MNYNDYDGNGKENNFDVSLIFTDKKYRARALLVFYALIFFAIIVFIRTGINDNNSSTLGSDSLNDSNGVVTDNNIVNDPNVDEEFVYTEDFNYLMSNNYEFEFTLYSDDNTFVASGKRYNDKYDFILTDGVSIIEYLAIGDDVSAEVDGEYHYTNLPYYYINYYDNDTLYKIISDSSLVGDDVYEISNKMLYNYLDSSYRKKLNNEDLTNEIKVIKKNNFVVGIEIDLTNIINSLEITSTNSTKVVLNYSNFNLIDDFEVIL